MGDITAQEVRAALRAIAEAMSQAKEDLTRLDSAIGDGDLGITLTRGFSALARCAEDLPGDDIGALLVRMGIEMNRASPSTMGTLLSTALLRAGSRVAGARKLSLHQIGEMLAAAAEGIRQRGKAEVGDKTILDALVPAAEAFKAAVERGSGLPEAWDRATEAAEQGFQRTADMASRVGRAGWFGEKTRGTPDPGALACVVVFRAIRSLVGEWEGGRRSERETQEGGS